MWCCFLKLIRWDQKQRILGGEWWDTLNSSIFNLFLVWEIRLYAFFFDLVNVGEQSKEGRDCFLFSTPAAIKEGGVGVNGSSSSNMTWVSEWTGTNRETREKREERGERKEERGWLVGTDGGYHSPRLPPRKGKRNSRINLFLSIHTTRTGESSLFLCSIFELMPTFGAVSSVKLLPFGHQSSPPLRLFTHISLPWPLFRS